MSEAEASQVFDAKLEEGMDSVKQLTKIVSDLTIEIGPRVEESKGELVGIPTIPVLESYTAQQHKDDGVIPPLLNSKEVLSNEEEKYPKIESDRESQEVRGGRFLDEWEDIKRRSGVVAMIPREFQTSNTVGSATEDRYEHFLHDGENIWSIEEIRRRYTKIIEERQLREPNVQDTTVSAGKEIRKTEQDIYMCGTYWFLLCKADQ